MTDIPRDSKEIFLSYGDDGEPNVCSSAECCNGTKYVKAVLAEKPMDKEVQEAIEDYREAYDWLVDNGDDHRSLPDARAAFGTIFEAVETLIRAATQNKNMGEK